MIPTIGIINPLGLLGLILGQKKNFAHFSGAKIFFVKMALEPKRVGIFKKIFLLVKAKKKSFVLKKKIFSISRIFFHEIFSVVFFTNHAFESTSQ